MGGGNPLQPGGIALAFGMFQAGMLILGWGAGTLVLGIIAPFDHWVAFALLVAIGVKMILESRKEEEAPPDLTLTTLLVLSVATSIDSLAVGISLAVLSPEILVPAMVIGAVTFGIALAGALLGGRIREAYGGRMELLGGLVVIFIGIRILLEHTGRSEAPGSLGISWNVKRSTSSAGCPGGRGSFPDR